MSSSAREISWTAEDCAGLLDKSKRSGNHFMGCCPAHPDVNPSLLLRDADDGGLIARCFSGCSYAAVIEALERKGASIARRRKREEPFSDHPQLGAPSAHWDYHDVMSRVILRVCRWEQPSGKKDIRPLVRTADGWRWAHHPTPRPLFQLDRLANEPDKPVIVVEGEKTAVAAQKLFPDHIATTWPGGAAAMGQADLEPLRDRTVTLIPDCDAPGRKAMAWIQNALKATARSVRTVDPGRLAKDLAEGWDFADALREGRDVSGWLAQSNAEPEQPRIVLCQALEIAQRKRRAWWLLKLYVERDATIIMFGDLGTLKSFLALHWGLLVAVQGHQVVYLSAEGKGLPQRIRGWAINRWGERWEAELGKVPFFGIEQPLNLSAEERIADLLQSLEHGAITPALIIVDTVSKNSDGRVEASNDDANAYLNLIDQKLRVPYRATVIYVHHTGHMEKQRARGPYTLMANTDANFRLERPDAGKLLITVTAGRMKDTEPPAPFSMQARIVETGEIDDEGRAVTTLVLDETETVAVAIRKRPTGKVQRAILNTLEARQRDATGSLIWTVDDIRKVGDELSIPRTSARDAIPKLIEDGLLKKVVGGLSLGYAP